jgi:hypothetical protein
LAVGHYDAGFGSALDGVHNVSGAEGNVKVRNIVLVKKRGGMRGDAYAKDTDVFIFENEMMMGLLPERNGYWSLSV